MLKLFAFIFLIPTLSFAANTTIQIHFKAEKSAAVVTIDQVGGEGEIFNLIRTLDPVEKHKVQIQNADRSINMTCVGGSFTANCTFAFFTKFPNVVVAAEENGFYAKGDLSEFTGTEVLSQNPNLTIPLTFEINGIFFELKLGQGRFFAGGNKKPSPSSEFQFADTSEPKICPKGTKLFFFWESPRAQNIGSCWSHAVHSDDRKFTCVIASNSYYPGDLVRGTCCGGYL